MYTPKENNNNGYPQLYLEQYHSESNNLYLDGKFLIIRE